MEDENIKKLLDFFSPGEQLIEFFVYTSSILLFYHYFF